METEEVYLAYQNPTLYLKVRGHVTAKLCRELRHKVHCAYEEAMGDWSLAVDLSDCSYMDSTFLGLLVIFNRKYCQPLGNRLVIHNPTPGCEDLLKDVGLLERITVHRGPRPELELDEKLGSGDTVTADFLLKAHEELMNLSDENKKRFSLIHGILKKEAGCRTGRP